jgi:hypothetical protein
MPPLPLLEFFEELGSFEALAALVALPTFSATIAGRGRATFRAFGRAATLTAFAALATLAALILSCHGCRLQVSMAKPVHGLRLHTRFGGVVGYHIFQSNRYAFTGNTTHYQRKQHK